MTKRLQDYVTESESWVSTPAVGDQFAINIREECLLETHIVERDADSIVLAADDRLMELLEQYDMLSEKIQRYGSVGSSAGQGYTLGEYNFGGARKPRFIGKPAAQPAVNVDPDAVGSVRELPDGSREQRTETGWKKIVPPSAHKPRAMTEGELITRMMELAGMPNAAHNDPLAAKAADLAPVGTEQDPTTATTIDEDDNQRGLDHAYEVYGNRHGYYAWRKSPPSPVLNIGITNPQLTGLTDWDPRSPEIQDFVKQHMKPVNFTHLSAGMVQLILRELPPPQQGMSEGAMSDIDMDLRHIAKTARMDALVDAMRGEFGIKTQQYLQDMMDDVDHNLERRGMLNTNMQTKLRMLMDTIRELYAQEDLDEAEYQGRDVPLGKPMQGDVKKFKVYVKDPKTGNVKKVNFGDKTMRIKKSNPARRKSFRARHNCDNPGPRTKARYWSCRKW